MSPRVFAAAAAQSVDASVRGTWLAIGIEVRELRRRRRWHVRALALKAGVSPDVVYRIESGKPTSLEAVVRVTAALGLRLEVRLSDPRRRDARPTLSTDPVHSAMGELEAAHLRTLGYKLGIDEPYQHYQFAGRADVVAWDVETRALLHIENRTRFPDFQEMAGAFNAKRAYLGPSIAGRVGVRGWRSETHLIAALWSSEVLHALRMRPDSFRALCPDGGDAFLEWWLGRPPRNGNTGAFIVLDPLASGRQRQFVDLATALATRPRYRGYSDAATALARAA